VHSSFPQRRPDQLYFRYQVLKLSCTAVDLASNREISHVYCTRRQACQQHQPPARCLQGGLISVELLQRNVFGVLARR
jgi:hypothetical protein